MSEFKSDLPEKEKTTDKKFSPLAATAVVQTVFVTVIIVTLMAVKLFSPALFEDVKQNYKERFLRQTDVSEVWGEESNKGVVNGDEI